MPTHHLLFNSLIVSIFCVIHNSENGVEADGLILRSLRAACWHTRRTLYSYCFSSFSPEAFYCYCL